MSIHPSAVIQKGAEIAEGSEIGPYCVIGPNVVIGAGTRLIAHVVVDGWTTIGKECTIFPFASIGSQTQDLKFRGAKTYVKIGDKTTLREYVTVNSGTNEDEVVQVGNGCLLMACAHVAHACRVGDGVIMANGAALAGHVIVEDLATIGGMSGIHQFVRIGRVCMVGAMTKITQDAPPYMLLDGNPAATYGLNSIGLKRKNIPEQSQKNLKQAFRILYRSQLTLPQAIARIESDVPPCPEVVHLTDFLRHSERGIVKGAAKNEN
jgi:UDP-N-acetylglucosamine acyltransferase